MSFELVPGACCCVRFSSTLVKNGTNSIDITLNINSTGAKTVDTVAYNKHIADITGSYNHNSLKAISPVVVYTGSSYIIGMTSNYRDATD